MREVSGEPREFTFTILNEAFRAHRITYQDAPDNSPSLRGFLWSHIGWILSDRYATTRVDLIHDFQEYPELRWLNKYHVIPPVALRVDVPYRWLGHARLGLLHQYGDSVAQFVHDQFTFAYLRSPALRHH